MCYHHPMDVRFETFGPMCQKNLPHFGLVMGEDAFMVEHCIQQVQHALKKAHPKLKTHRLNIQKADHWPSLQDVLSSRDFFTPHQLVVCHYPQTALTTKNQALIESILARLDSNTHLIFTTKKPSAKQKKHPLFVACQQRGFTITLWPLDARALTTWIQHNNWQLRFTQSQLKTLLQQTDQQLWAIAQTLERLALTQGTGAITDEALNDAITTEYDPGIYTLINDALLGRAAWVLKRFEALATPAIMPALTGALNKEIHLLHRIAYSARHEQPLEQALTKHCAWPSKRTRLQAALKRHDTTALSALIHRLFTIDQINKGMQPGCAQAAMQDVLIQLATHHQQPTLTTL